jgi:hypothetical protein
MKPCWARLAFIVCLAGIGAVATNQSAARTPASSASQACAVIPPLVGFVGTLCDLHGTPLWLEARNVRADGNERYSVMLGSTMADGLPADVFGSGDARWLGVQPAGQPEQARVMLLSVPYALKAGDAQTLGGLPPSAFMLSVPVANPQMSGPAAVATSGSSPATTSDVPTNLSQVLPSYRRRGFERRNAQ